MNIAVAHKIFKRFESDHLSFLFRGNFSDNITDHILRLNNVTAEDKDEQRLKKKLSFLMVECFQNIIRHKDEPEIINKTNDKPEMFLLRHTGTNYYIASCNLINNTKVDTLKLKLKDINALSGEQLKSLQLNTLVNSGISGKGGAGLGLIEMARQSGEKLEFEFEFINYFLSLFYIQVKFRGQESGENPAALNGESIQRVKDFYRFLSEENILLLYKGDFSQELILPVLQMIERELSMKSAKLKFQKRMIYLLIELLQNVSNHAEKWNNKKEGVFIISRKGSEYMLVTGNIIKKQHSDSLKAQIGKLNALNDEALTALYKKNLSDLSEKRVKGGARLGLIDIARYSKDKIVFDFIPVNEELSFFSLGITV